MLITVGQVTEATAYHGKGSSIVMDSHCKFYTQHLGFNNHSCDINSGKVSHLACDKSKNCIEEAA